MTRILLRAARSGAGRARLFVLVLSPACAQFAYAQLACAQQAPSAPAPSSGPAGPVTPLRDAPTTDIVVSGQRPAEVTSIDRKSYSLRGSIQATTGSAIDVMRNLPSVTVDEDGNPSLRGDANVQILIDGRPAPQFNTANRGAALQQLGADGIARIEVMTNPPANFKPDGSAGVINIITKKGSGRRTISANASVGSDGRFNLAATGSTHIGQVAVHGSLTLRHDLRNRIGTDDRVISDDQNAAFVSGSRQETFVHNNRLSKIAALGADYDLSKVDRISVEGTYYQRSETTAFSEQNTSVDADLAPIGTVDRLQSGHAHESNTTALARYHRDIGKGGDGLTVLAQRAEALETQYYAYRDRYSGASSGPMFEDQRHYSAEVTRELNLDWVMALAAQAKLTTGYDLQRDKDTYDNLGTTRTGATARPVVDSSFTNRFLYGQTIHAFYASYERPIGHMTVLSGLRLEQARTDGNQVTAAIQGHTSYFRAYPNLHLADAVSDHASLTLSYGRRVIRPDPDDLNPYPIQQDAFTVRKGNPALLPEEIQSFEAGWSFERSGTSRSATVYLRESRNRVTNVIIPISPTVVAITKQNLGQSTSGGVELATSSKLFKGLDYSLNGNVFYNSIDASNLGYDGVHAAFSYEAKFALNWHANAKDTFQFNLGALGRRLVPQGYRPGSIGADLGARHQLRKNLALTATLSDIFASRHDGMVTAIPGLNDVSRRQQTGRIFFLGLSWSPPGAKPKGSDKFEYDKQTG